ncbi:hypothetical protein D3C85_562320 [compost metagenome]
MYRLRVSEVKKLQKIYLIPVFFIQAGAWAKDPYVDINSTMCAKGENIYISCAFRTCEDENNYVGAVASVCAKFNMSSDSGYVQYRFGTPSYGLGPASVELQYPEKKIPGANQCSGIGLREAFSSIDVDRVNACLVYTKTDVQSEGKLSREPDGISIYSVVSSDTPRLVYEFPYAGTEGKVTDAFFLPVGGEGMLFVIHRIEAPRSWDSVGDIYDVSVFRLEGDNLLLDKNFTRFFDLGGDSVDEQGRLTYIYPYKDKKSVEAVVGSPLFYSIIADKEITGTILEKTFLFDGGSEPIQQSKTKMYLIEGDRVLVTDSTAGWCKVSYEAKIKMITKWAQCKSINFSAS